MLGAEVLPLIRDFTIHRARAAVSDSTPRFPESLPILAGESQSLRELREADIPGWFARATDREAADLAGDPVPESIAEGAAWLQRHRERFMRRTGLRWAIVPRGTFDSVGTVGFSLDAPGALSASLGIVVARSSWGHGIGTAAMSTAIRYAFAELGLQEIRAEVLQRNAASIRLLGKCGFALDRVLDPTPDEPEVMLLYKRFADTR